MNNETVNIKKESEPETHVDKETIKMKCTYKALENGWTVKKVGGHNTFEFSRTNDQQFNSSNSSNHHSRRAISAPIIKKTINFFGNK